MLYGTVHTVIDHMHVKINLLHRLQILKEKTKLASVMAHIASQRRQGAPTHPEGS